MDLRDVLFGFEQINPGFDLDGSPDALRRAAQDANQALHPENGTNKILMFLIGNKLRDWYAAESVEEREALHGQIRGLGAFLQELQQVVDTHEAVQESMRATQ